MCKRVLVLLYFVCRCWPALSQNIGMGTATPNPSAALDITNTNKGLLIPRMTSSAITGIPNPAKGLMVYDSLANQLLVNMGSPAAPNWQNIIANSGWGLTGNSGTTPAINFIGTTDSVALLFRINNQWAGMIDSGFANNGASIGNTYLGYGAGKYAPTQIMSTAFGYQAMDSNRIGQYNTAFGVQSLYADSDRNDDIGAVANFNTAVGYQANSIINYINNNATSIGFQASFKGGGGTAVGYQAGFKGRATVAIGAQAHFSPFVGIISSAGSIANGVLALYNNADYGGGLGGGLNVATGYAAMYNNSLGSYNVANGYHALYKNYSGNYNVALGAGAMYSENDNYSQNTAVGSYSLLSTTSAEGNTALGYNAGQSFDNGYYNCFIGAETDASGANYYNTIALGHGTLVTAPNMMRVGNTATTSIGGPVGWSVISDGRVKQNIREDVPGLAFINKLRPISYTIDVASVDRIQQAPQKTNTGQKTIEKTEHPQMTAALKAKEDIVYTGFVAQEVEQAARSLNYDFSGVDAARNDKDLYSLRYGDFVTPLIKAVQELAGKNDELKKANELLMKQREQVMQQLDELEKKIK